MELRVGIKERAAGTDDLGRPPLTLLEAPTVPEHVLLGALRDRNTEPCTGVVEGIPLASSAAGLYLRPP